MRFNCKVRVKIIKNLHLTALNTGMTVGNLAIINKEIKGSTKFKTLFAGVCDCKYFRVYVHKPASFIHFSFPYIIFSLLLQTHMFVYTKYSYMAL